MQYWMVIVFVQKLMIFVFFWVGQGYESPSWAFEIMKGMNPCDTTPLPAIAEYNSTIEPGPPLSAFYLAITMA